jgi:hypothetical protein
LRPPRRSGRARPSPQGGMHRGRRGGQGGGGDNEQAELSHSGRQRP